MSEVWALGNLFGRVDDGHNDHSKYRSSPSDTWECLALLAIQDSTTSFAFILLPGIGVYTSSF
ncbi:MAG: hypothetical protein MI861_07875, partial [Pirellulales bacterium]|nr:hypothetical protein [Pirellulales bacterium]